MGSMGKGGDSDTRAGKKTEKMAEDYFERTKPLRKDMVRNYEGFMEGGYDVSQNPVWGSSRGVMEDQYDVARENVISNTPKGGALNEGLTDVEMGRARSLGDLSAQISQDEYNKAYGMATGSPQVSMGTMASLAGSQAMANSQQSAGKMGALGDIGMGAGMYMGSK